MRPPDGEGSKRWPEAWVRNVQIFRWSFVSLGIAREWHSGPKLVWWPFKRWSKTSSKLKTGWLPQKHQARHPEIQGVDGTITATKGIWCICFGGLWSHSYETTRGGLAIFWPWFQQDEFPLLTGYILGLSSYTSFSAEAKLTVSHHFVCIGKCQCWLQHNLGGATTLNTLEATNWSSHLAEKMLQRDLMTFANSGRWLKNSGFQDHRLNWVMVWVQLYLSKLISQHGSKATCRAVDRKSASALGCRLGFVGMSWIFVIS